MPLADNYEDHINAMTEEQRKLDTEWAERIAKAVNDKLIAIELDLGPLSAMFCAAGIHLYQHAAETAYFTGGDPHLLHRANHLINVTLNAMHEHGGLTLDRDKLKVRIDDMIAVLNTLQDQYANEMMQLAPPSQIEKAQQQH